MIYIDFEGVLKHMPFKNVKKKHAILSDLGTSFWSIFSPQVKIVAILRQIEYSEGSKNFKKFKRVSKNFSG